MTASPASSCPSRAISNALAINIGTLSPHWVEAMLIAGATTGLSHVKIASVQRTMDGLTAKFR